MGKIERIQVAPEDRERLVKLVKDRNTPQKIVWRSQIVLFAGEGIGAVEVATRVGKSVPQLVGKTRGVIGRGGIGREVLRIGRGLGDAVDCVESHATSRRTLGGARRTAYS